MGSKLNWTHKAGAVLAGAGAFSLGSASTRLFTDATTGDILSFSGAVFGSAVAVWSAFAVTNAQLDHVTQKRRDMWISGIDRVLEPLGKLQAMPKEGIGKKVGEYSHHHLDVERACQRLKRVMTIAVVDDISLLLAQDDLYLFKPVWMYTLDQANYVMFSQNPEDIEYLEEVVRRRGWGVDGVRELWPRPARQLRDMLLQARSRLVK